MFKTQVQSSMVKGSRLMVSYKVSFACSVTIWGRFKPWCVTAAVRGFDNYLKQYEKYEPSAGEIHLNFER